MKKVKRKLSSVIENKIVQELLLKLVGEKKLTYSEAMIYTFMRSRAFNKSKTCEVDHKFIAAILNIHKNKVLSKINKLERLGLLSPIYFIKYEGYKTKIEGSYKEVINKFSLSAIQYKHYKVRQLSGERGLQKQYIKGR